MKQHIIWQTVMFDTKSVFKKISEEYNQMLPQTQRDTLMWENALLHTSQTNSARN